MFNSSNTKRIKIEAANATLVEGHHEDHNGENLVKNPDQIFITARVCRWKILSNHCVTTCKHCYLTSF